MTNHECLTLQKSHGKGRETVSERDEERKEGERRRRRQLSSAGGLTNLITV